MKHRTQILLSVLLMLMLVLSACGNRNREEPTEEPVAAAPLAEAEAATDTPEPAEEPAAEEAAEEPAEAEEAGEAEEAAEEEMAEEEMSESSVVFDAVNDYMSNMAEGYNSVGDIDTFKDILATGETVLIDVRETDEYEEGHIPGAVNVPLRTLAQNLEMVPADQPVMVYCASGHRAGIATTSLQTLGYDNVRAYAPGWRAWSAAEEEVETEGNTGETFDVPEIDAELMEAVDTFLSTLPEGWLTIDSAETLQDAIDAGVPLFDVREPDEFEGGAIGDAVNIPIREVVVRAGEVPVDEQSIVYCKSGFRAAQSLTALHLLGHMGVRAYPPGWDGWSADQGEAAEAPAEVEEAMESDFDVTANVDEFMSSIPEGFLSVSDIDAFKDAMENTDVYLIDVREASDYEEGHIPGAVNIPLRTLADNVDKIPNDQPVMVYCASGHRAGLGLAALGMLGYDNVKSFSPGWDGWSEAEEEVSTEATEATTFEMPDVDPEMLAAVTEFLNNIPEGWMAIKDVEQFAGAIDAGAFVLDVRETGEYEEGHIEGATNIPLRTLAQNTDQIPTDQPIVVYCKSGHRAAMALAGLQTMGMDNSRAFPGGFVAWEEAGEEVAVAE